MKSVFIILSLCAASSFAQEAPSFQWDNAGNMAVLFSNGYQDTLVLRYHNPIPARAGEFVEACTFLGTLENDPMSSGAVLGCPGDDEFEVTLHSQHHTQSRFLVKASKVEILESPYANIDAMVHDVNDLVMGEYGSEEKAFPAAMTMNFQLGYDFNFNEHTQSAGGPVEYLRKVVTSSQADFFHPTLTTKITIKIANSKYYPDEDWRATKDDIYEIRKFNQKDQSIHANAYFCKDLENDFGVIGIGFVAVACGSTNNRATINELRPTASQTAHVLSHETGHNLGMHHDFDHHEQKCTGIMDYGNPPDVWSKCSVADFTKYYNGIVGSSGKWCMS